MQTIFFIKNDYKEYRIRIKPKIISTLLLWIVLNNYTCMHSKYFDKYQKSFQSWEQMQWTLVFL